MDMPYFKSVERDSPYTKASLFSVLTFMFGAAVAQGNHNNSHTNASTEVESSPDYKEVYLTVDADSNWPTEFCLDVKKGVFSYSFEAPHPTKFGTHLHDSSGTVEQIKDLIVHKYSTDLTLDSDGGDFCFTWEKTVSYEENWDLLLRYQLQ